MASLLYEFLNVFSAGEEVQKTLDKEYNWMVSLLYEFLNVLSEPKYVQKIFDNEYNCKVFHQCEPLYVSSICMKK